jgi:hypothetical protein
VYVVFAVFVHPPWLILEITEDITQMPMNNAIAAEMVAMTDCVTIPFLAIKVSLFIELVGFITT